MTDSDKDCCSVSSYSLIPKDTHQSQPQCITGESSFPIHRTLMI